MNKNFKNSLKNNIGIYIIGLTLLISLITFLYQFSFGSNYSADRINLFFGPYAYVYLILVLIAIVSIFVKYKGNLIVMSLPFLWDLLLPLKTDASPDSFFRGNLFNIYLYFTSNPMDLTGVLYSALRCILPILIIVYLFLKFFKNIENKKFEIISTMLIIIFYVLELIKIIK